MKKYHSIDLIKKNSGFTEYVENLENVSIQLGIPIKTSIKTINPNQSEQPFKTYVFTNNIPKVIMSVTCTY